jgi:hypothetical protein
MSNTIEFLLQDDMDSRQKLSIAHSPIHMLTIVLCVFVFVTCTDVPQV